MHAQDHLADVKVRQGSMVTSEDSGRCTDDRIGNIHSECLAYLETLHVFIVLEQ